MQVGGLVGVWGVKFRIWGVFGVSSFGEIRFEYVLSCASQGDARHQ